MHEVEEQQDEEEIFFGSVTTNGNPWIVKIDISKSSFKFKIDTGADVTVLPHTENYPKLCMGLGEVHQPYTIKLKPGAVPFSLKTPWRIPLPLMDKVKQELSRMEQLRVICRIEEPTDW